MANKRPEDLEQVKIEDVDCRYNFDEAIQLLANGTHAYRTGVLKDSGQNVVIQLMFALAKEIQTLKNEKRNTI